MGLGDRLRGLLRRLWLSVCERDRQVEELRGYGFRVLRVEGSCTRFTVVFAGRSGGIYETSCMRRGGMLLCRTVQLG